MGGYDGTGGLKAYVKPRSFGSYKAIGGSGFTVLYPIMPDTHSWEDIFA